MEINQAKLKRGIIGTCVLSLASLPHLACVDTPQVEKTDPPPQTSRSPQPEDLPLVNTKEPQHTYGHGASRGETLSRQAREVQESLQSMLHDRKTNIGHISSGRAISKSTVRATQHLKTFEELLYEAIKAGKASAQEQGFLEALFEDTHTVRTLLEEHQIIPQYLTASTGAASPLEPVRRLEAKLILSELLLDD